MIVQIIDINVETIVSGHVFKDECPDRVNYGMDNVKKIRKISTITKSGHSVNNAVTVDFNHASGQVSGQNNTF